MSFKPFVDVDLETLTESLNIVAANSLSASGRVTSQAGTPPATTGADIVLASITIPAGAIGTLADQLENFEIFAQGKFGATANNKRLKIIVNPTAPVVGSAVVGGTTILDTGAVNTNGGGFVLDASLVRTGVNTQLGFNYGSIVGTTHQGTSAPVALAITDGAAFSIVVTGNATTATTDILLNIFEVDAMG